MRRILLALGPSTGGIGRHVAGLAEQARAVGHEVWVAAPPSTLQRFGLDAPHYGQIEMTGRGSLGHLGKLARRCDLVHAHGLTASVWCGVATAWSTPVISTWHNLLRSGSRSSRADRLIERYVARRFDLNLCVSPDLYDVVHRHGGHAKLAPVGPPRLARPEFSRTVNRRELGVGRNTKLVLALARLHPQKGLDVLIRAATGASVPLVLAVAGVGPEEQALKSLATELGVRVRWLGLRHDVPDLLLAADVLAMPSRWEGSPLALHEAFQAGRPTVASAVGGIPALVGSASMLVTPDDPRALRSAIEMIVTHPEVSEELVRNGREVLRRWPDNEQACRSVLSAYERLLGRRR